MNEIKKRVHAHLLKRRISLFDLAFFASACAGAGLVLARQATYGPGKRSLVK